MESSIPFWSSGRYGWEGDRSAVVRSVRQGAHRSFSETDSWIQMILGPIDAIWDGDYDGRKYEWRRPFHLGASRGLVGKRSVGDGTEVGDFEARSISGSSHSILVI